MRGSSSLPFSLCPFHCMLGPQNSYILHKVYLTRTKNSIFLYELYPNHYAKEVEVPKKSPPATTPEGRENQLIAAAVDLAERQLLDGTASPSVITHFLKLASTKQQLEIEKLKSETEFLRAKADAVQSNQRSEELYAEAIAAMRKYSGVGDDDDYSEEML